MKSRLPTRVLDLGGKAYSNIIRLHCSSKDEEGNYIALSHCWGQFTSDQRAKFCTFKSNINDRCEGIEVDILPKTFRDAIRVTRELGKRYLWIDSPCIIQDDIRDWEKESKTMEIVYSMAYCTIAATSSKDSTRGFLKPREQREFVKIESLPKSPSPQLPPQQSAPKSADYFFNLLVPRQRKLVRVGSREFVYKEVGEPPPEVPQFPLYICEPIDDFTNNVEKSILNSRAWVLQERCLSRRIIHFSENQTYLECGNGVHCETLTLMYK